MSLCQLPPSTLGTQDLVSTASPAKLNTLNWSQLYLSVGLTTTAALLLELSLTRIFSVVFFYHFAFLAISIALFGLGAGGVFSYVVAGGNVYFKLGTLAALNSLAVLGSLVYLLTRTGELKNGTLALVYFASALPFFFSGTVVSIAIGEAIKRVHRVYFFDLLGAAAGCLALVPLLNWFGGPNAVLATAILFAVSAAIWYNLSGSMRGRVGA